MPFLNFWLILLYGRPPFRQALQQGIPFKSTKTSCFQDLRRDFGHVVFSAFGPWIGTRPMPLCPMRRCCFSVSCGPAGRSPGTRRTAHAGYSRPTRGLLYISRSVFPGSDPHVCLIPYHRDPVTAGRISFRSPFHARPTGILLSKTRFPRNIAVAVRRRFDQRSFAAPAGKACLAYEKTVSAYCVTSRSSFI